MKQLATRLILASGFLLILIIWAQSLAAIGRPAAGGSVPAVQYLGESGSYEIDPSQNFLVKPVGRLRFVVFPGPTYAAQPGERVWSTSGDEAPDPLNHTTATIGPVDPGCVVRFTIVDDDPDERLNHFQVNGTLVYTAAQGMVSSGQFIVNESGTLKIEANDSIGLWAEPCESTVTLTPTVTPTGTATSTPTAVPTDTPVPTATDVPTETPEPTITPTVDPSATATPTPRYTPPVRVTAQVTLEVPSTETPVPTATSTAAPTETPTVLPTVPPTDLETVTPTPTEVVNWEPACLRINFDIGGDHALQGSYVVREVNGRTLYSWPAEAGWQDSGWIYDIDITFEAVYVDVWFYPGDGSAPIMMDMLNPAPGTTHGWLSRGQCHALEVAWSGGDQFATPVTGGNLNP